MRRFVYSLITGQDPNKEGDGSVFPSFIDRTIPIIRPIARPLLLVLSFIYINAVGLIRFFYKINILKSVKPKSKVVSVGNITWGGTGKTSLVALLSKFLDAKNKRPAILIRGYGEDEDRMLKEQLDAIVLSGKNRIKNAREAEDKYNADVLILDDGFQHWRIKRDLDIVTINATNPFGNGKVIPAGILREPLSALKRADIIILTKVNLVDKEEISGIENIIYNITPDAEIFEAEYQPISLTETSRNQKLGLDYIAGEKVCAVVAIGDNNSFFKMLLDLGAQITAKFSFPDHHKYTQRNIKDIVDTAKKTHSDAIITTPKDWVRLTDGVRHLERNSHSQCLTPSPLILNITIKIKDEEKFFRRISTLLNC